MFHLLVNCNIWPSNFLTGIGRPMGSFLCIFDFWLVSDSINLAAIYGSSWVIKTQPQVNAVWTVILISPYILEQKLNVYIWERWSNKNTLLPPSHNIRDFGGMWHMRRREYYGSTVIKKKWWNINEYTKFHW